MSPRLNPSPETLVTRGWASYALLDSGHGRKLERYGRFTEVRPEPQCFWSPRDAAAFDRADAVFDPTDEDEAGRWRFAGKPVDTFPLAWRGVLAGTMLAFARAMGEFGATLMVAGNIPGRTQTLSLAVYDAVQAGQDDLANFLVLLTSVVCVAILFGSGKLLKPRY